jgi:hypothetical protein
VGVDRGNSLGNLIFNPNSLFGLQRELREGVGEGTHILCLVCNIGNHIISHTEWLKIIRFHLKAEFFPNYHLSLCEEISGNWTSKLLFPIQHKLLLPRNKLENFSLVYLTNYPNQTSRRGRRKDRCILSFMPSEYYFIYSCMYYNHREILHSDAMLRSPSGQTFVQIFDGDFVELSYGPNCLFLLQCS